MKLATIRVDGGHRAARIDGAPGLVQIEVVGDVVVDTDNPEVTAPRYRYRSLESFDVTGPMAVAGMAASTGTERKIEDSLNRTAAPAPVSNPLEGGSIPVTPAPAASPASGAADPLSVPAKKQ